LGKHVSHCCGPRNTVLHCISAAFLPLTEEKLLNNKDDLSGCFRWMVGELITHARYDGH